jgi:hypothetical protein
MIGFYTLAFFFDNPVNNLGSFELGLFASGYIAMMIMCEHSNDPLGTISK